MSTLLGIIWGIVKIAALVVLMVHTITYALAFYERANSIMEKEAPEPLPGLLEFLGSFIIELLVAYLNIIIYPIGYIEPDPLREISTETADRPVILVHGYFMNRACFLVFYLRLRQTGKKSLFTINLRPLTAPVEDLAHQLSEKVEEVLVLTKKDKVDIVGHSMGGLVARYYIEQMNGAKKVNTLVTLGTPHHGTKLSVFGIGGNAREMHARSNFIEGLGLSFGKAGVKYFSLWSTLDNMVLPQESSNLPAPATNIKFHNIGHLTLLFSPRVFLKTREILEGKEIALPGNE